MTFTGRELRSTIEQDGRLTVSLETVKLDAPGDDEVIVQIEASPINPSDLGLMLPVADLATLTSTGSPDAPALSFTIAENRLPAFQRRFGQSLSVGNEGAGTVVAAGRNAKMLEGRQVALFGGGMFADYRRTNARNVVPLPEGVSTIDAASFFVNPLTALGFVETARRDGHKAIVHTAAASNLGQMLLKICLADNIPLINIVRSEEQVALLRNIGAVEVLNSQDEEFGPRLADAIRRTGATVAFDAIGGGKLGATVLQAMEKVAVDNMSDYGRYGSDVFKQLYIYGALDLAPTLFNRAALGFSWGISGWLLSHFLQRAEQDVIQRMQQRVLAEINSTFASHYTNIIGLSEALQPDILRAYERKATGEKYLIDPTRN